MSRIKFLNTYIDNLTMQEAVDRIDQLIREKSCAYVVTPNLDHIVMIEKEQEFKKIYSEADLILCDGKPLIWISKYLNKPIKEKVSGSDLFPKLCLMATKNGYSMFFLGAAEGIASKAADKLTKKYPGLQVVGTYSPPYGFEDDTDEMKNIIELIHNASPHILIVGLGTPKQEKFISKNRIKLEVPVSLGLGASLDFEAGNVKRAPKWMTNHGLEWLFRITQDPKRLAIRYWKDAVSIVPIILRYRKK